MSIRSEGLRSSDPKDRSRPPAPDPRRSGPYTGRDERKTSAAQAAQHATVRERREIEQPPCFHVQPLRPLPDAPVPCVASGGASTTRTGRIAGRTAAPASSRSTRSRGQPLPDLRIRSPAALTRPLRREPRPRSFGRDDLDRLAEVGKLEVRCAGDLNPRRVLRRERSLCEDRRAVLLDPDVEHVVLTGAAGRGRVRMARLAVRRWSSRPSTSSGPTYSRSSGSVTRRMF